MNQLPGNERPLPDPRSADAAKPFDCYSIEVLPKALEKIDSLRDLLPSQTRVYIAHVEGTPFEAMLGTARRLVDEGFAAMPHIPARLVADAQTLVRWVGRYREEAGVTQALVLAGGLPSASGAYTSSMQLLESGVFDRFGFRHLHLAGHPEGNKDIDPDGSTALADQALLWKQDFASRTDAQLALVTQFGFDPASTIRWAERIAALGVSLPIHVGIAGPAKLQTLIRYGITCGVGPSLKVLQKRARDFTKLLLPYEPTDYLSALQAHRQRHPASHLAQVHVFALGGIAPAAQWFNRALGLQPAHHAGVDLCPV